MTKKILPMMIGVALAGGMAAAQADVTVFGHIDESVVNSKDYVNDGYNTQFVCTTCSIGFKGSEDLGNGLKAIFSLDFQYDTNNRNPQTTKVYGPTKTTTANGAVNTFTTTKTATTNNSITDRDQWLGLAGNFGQVRVGTISTSYKSHGALLDPGYRTSAQMRDWGLQSLLHSGAGEEGQGRATNTARYDSPDWNGLQVTAQYTLDSNNNDGNDDNPYGGGVQYSNGGLLVFADYITTDTGSDDDAYKVGAKFTLDNFSVFGQYEWDGGLISTNTFGTPGFNPNGVSGADVWMAGGSYTMGNNTLYAAYGQGANAENTAINTSYDSWEVVGVHSMSKQTLVYLGYATLDPEDNSVDDPEAWTLGMKHKF